MNIENDTVTILTIFTILFVFVASVILIRRLFRINDIVFYLEKINEKMTRIEGELKKQADKVTP